MSIYIANVFDKLGIKNRFRWLYGHGLTGESFAFHSVLDDKNLSYKYFLPFNFFCHFSWVLGSLIGAWLVTETKTKASELVNLQYALTAMMVYVLVLLSNSRIKTIVALVSITTMVVLSIIYESHLLCWSWCVAEEKRLIIIILLMAVVTYIPRVLPLHINQKQWPKWIKTSLDFLPVAIVASITIPNVLINGYTSQFLTSEFITTIFAIVVAYYSKNLIITILSSLLFFSLQKTTYLLVSQP